MQRDWPNHSTPLVCEDCGEPFLGPPSGGQCLACWRATEWVEDRGIMAQLPQEMNPCCA